MKSCDRLRTSPQTTKGKVRLRELSSPIGINIAYNQANMTDKQKHENMIWLSEFKGCLYGKNGSVFKV